MQLLAATDLTNYVPIAMAVGMSVVFAIVNVGASALLGPRRDGDIKGDTYESGMLAIGTTRKRFNVRFFVVAMTFLLFDVEVIFLYPWAVAYAQLEPQSPMSGLFLARILFFIGTSVLAYIYAWRKGVFRWD
ncbi:MAG: putative NADH-quinone oxidoreductase subunit [Planctomycetota bacterium]|jgi:NADH-quinone oxidoreductase subunit A